MNLSPRQMEVLKQMAEGKSEKMIADSLGISIKTIGKHKDRLFEKFDMHNSIGVVVQAIREGIITV